MSLTKSVMILMIEQDIKSLMNLLNDWFSERNLTLPPIAVDEWATEIVEDN